MKESNREIVERYCKRYEENQNILAVVFYGSRATNINEETADFDLLLMTNDRIREERYNEAFESNIFRCHKKSYESIIKSWDRDYVMLSILAHGQIIFGRGGNIEVLKVMALSKLKEPRKTLSEEEREAYMATVERRVKEIECKKESPEVYHLAHITVEKIRKFYERTMALPHIRSSKVYRVYTDKEYYEKNFVGVKLPEQDFIDLYLETVLNDEIGKNVKRLWKYCKQHINKI